MEDFKNIQAIWRRENKTNVPKISEIKKAIILFNTKRKRNNLIAVILIITIISVLILLMSFAPIKMVSTYLGLIIWLGTGAYAIVLKLRFRIKMTRLENVGNKEFLNKIEKEETKISNGKTKKQSILYSLWAIGFGLYLFENLSKSVESMLIGYGALVLYGLIIWFIYMPFMKKRFKNNIQNTILHIHKLKKQTNESI